MTCEHVSAEWPDVRRLSELTNIQQHRRRSAAGRLSMAARPSEGDMLKRYVHGSKSRLAHFSDSGLLSSVIVGALAAEFGRQHLARRLRERLNSVACARRGRGHASWIANLLSRGAETLRIPIAPTFYEREVGLVMRRV